MLRYVQVSRRSFGLAIASIWSAVPDLFELVDRSEARGDL